MDIAFAYKGRDTFRMLGATARDLIHLKIGRLRERVKVLSGEEQDPFDTYSTFLEAENASVKWLFVPTGSRSEFDNNLSISTSAMKSHVRTLASKVNIGLHPSYASLNKVDKISVEKRHLEEVIGAKIRFSRQHFLRFTLPDTFNVLDSEGMELDFSMGFHDEIGFRAGTAFPFAFYDLESDTPRALQLYPLVAMDSAMKNYLRLSPKQAQEKMNGLAADMRSTGGAFTSVWHNHSLSDRGEWKGWLEVYQYISRMFGSRR
jgi:hypothetical protein